MSLLFELFKIALFCDYNLEEQRCEFPLENYEQKGYTVRRTSQVNEMIFLIFLILRGLDLNDCLCKKDHSIKTMVKKLIKMKKVNFFLVTVFMTAMLAISCKDVASDEASTSKDVTIGEQVWMTENLNVDKFRNGDPISEAKTNEEWKRAAENKQPAWCYYDNDPTNGTKYGKLYNWYAVNDPRGLAPIGYHIPTDRDWTTITNYLGGKSVAGKKMMFTSEINDKTSVHEESSFSGLPGGQRLADGSFAGQEGNWISGCWWSSTEFDNSSSWSRYASGDAVYRNYLEKAIGLSVRCAKGEVTSKEIVASKEVATSIEVLIGEQLWMTENLNVETFRNGDPIPEAKTNEEWKQAGLNKQPAWCYYDNDPAEGDKYGKLYNFYAVNDARGLAPIGYHIPTYDECTTLTDHLGGESEAGVKMKSKTGWENNGNGTNESNFGGLPGGCRSPDGTSFPNGSYGHWWTSSEDDDINAWSFTLKSEDRNVRRSSYDHKNAGSQKAYGLSVRCLRDRFKEEATTSFETTYLEVSIGKQVWMAKNLSLAKFRNGDPIPQAKSMEEWLLAGRALEPVWCYVNNDSTTESDYGKLYNYFAIIDSRGLAPEGWHIPTDNEWLTLLYFLGDYNGSSYEYLDLAAKRMKSNTRWDENGNNESGFSGLPGGARDIDGTFSVQFGKIGCWWSRNCTAFNASAFRLSDNAGISTGHDQRKGYSVRCLRH